MKAPLFTLTLLIVALTFVSPAIGRDRSAVIKDGPNVILPGEGDYLVILHGWTIGIDNMGDARDFFSEAGFHVIGLHYPTRKERPDELIDDYIKPSIAKYCTDPEKKIHFLTHSLGGVLLRQYLQTDRPDNLGRVVMLAPPNNGIELVDQFSDVRAFVRFFGPTALQLRTDESSWPKRLGKADYPLGIIMGTTRHEIPITSKILPGGDDGIVSVDSGKVEGMSQLIALTGFHTVLPVMDSALEQANHFIESGKFTDEPPAQKTPTLSTPGKRFALRKR